jgi:hypothetical protein
MSILHCCQCVSRFTEKYIYGSLYLDRVDPNGIFSTPSPGQGYRWTYTGNQPQDSYTIFEYRKVVRYLYTGPTSNCNCTNAAGGKAIEDEQFLDSSAEDLGLIVKRFPGYWRRAGNASQYWGHHLVQYSKTLQWDNTSARYINEHWCGRECPGAPWPESRGFDKRTEFRLECSRINS